MYSDDVVNFIMVLIVMLTFLIIGECVIVLTKDAERQFKSITIKALFDDENDIREIRPPIVYVHYDSKVVSLSIENDYTVTIDNIPINERAWAYFPPIDNYKMYQSENQCIYTLDT